MVNKSMSIAHRAQALALLEADVPVKRIMEITGLSRSTIFRIRQVAKDRGYDPAIDKTFKDEYFEDARRSGRPRKTSVLAGAVAVVLEGDSQLEPQQKQQQHDDDHHHQTAENGIVTEDAVGLQLVENDDV